MRCAIHRAIVQSTSIADRRAIRYSQSSATTRLQSALRGSKGRLSIVVYCYSHSTQVLADFCLNFYCVLVRKPRCADAPFCSADSDRFHTLLYRLKNMCDRES
ncbi:unnamed protein product [Arctogadus glacialis]